MYFDLIIPPVYNCVFLSLFNATKHMKIHNCFNILVWVYLKLIWGFISLNSPYQMGFSQSKYLTSYWGNKYLRPWSLRRLLFHMCTFVVGLLARLQKKKNWTIETTADYIVVAKAERSRSLQSCFLIITPERNRDMQLVSWYKWQHWLQMINIWACKVKGHGQ